MQFSKEVEGIDVIINRVVKDSLKDKFSGLLAGMHKESELVEEDTKEFSQNGSKKG